LLGAVVERAPPVLEAGRHPPRPPADEGENDRPAGGVDGGILVRLQMGTDPAGRRERIVIEEQHHVSGRVAHAQVSRP
jgi:hypothetical protein